jgi:predicted NBD/HSP70 family sugar kinase
MQGSEGEKVRLTQYARAVARAIAPTVAAADVPLILAATESLATLDRSVDASEHLARGVLDTIYAVQLGKLRDRLNARRTHGRGSLTWPPLPPLPDQPATLAPRCRRILPVGSGARLEQA